LARWTPPEVEMGEMGVRIIAVRPNASSFDAPVLPSLPDQIAESASP